MGILSDILDPIFGSDTRKEDRKAQEYLDKSVGAFDDVSAPQLSDLELEQLVDLGDYQPVGFVQAPTVNAGADISFQNIDPRLASLERVSGSDFDNISVDPRLKNEQLQSLDALDEIIQGGGLTAADRAQLNEVQTDAAQADRGRREAILQNMQATGRGGSGMELLAQLQSSQAATDRQNQAGLDIAGTAQQRALDAIMQSGQLAGGMRDQEFGEGAEVARARDAIAQFNAQNANSNNLANANIANQMAIDNANRQLATQQYNRNTGIDVQKANAANALGAQEVNAQTANAAALANQQRRQDLSNQNVAIRNQQQQGNNAVQQQRFDNTANIAQNKAAAAQPGVDYYQGLGDRKTRKDAAYMDAFIKGGTAAAKAGAGS